MTFPNMKESGLYGRSLFAYLQKEKRPNPCTGLVALGCHAVICKQRTV